MRTDPQGNQSDLGEVCTDRYSPRGGVDSWLPRSVEGVLLGGQLPLWLSEPLLCLEVVCVLECPFLYLWYFERLVFVVLP